MNIGRIASKKAITVAPGASLEEAAKKMLQYSVGALVVTDSVGERSEVTGIITDRDIVRARLGHSGALASLNVADMMTRTPLVLDAQDSLANAVRHLQARGVRRAPVVDHDGQLLGFVSTDDLLAQIAAELSGLARLVAQQGRKRED